MAAVGLGVDDPLVEDDVADPAARAVHLDLGEPRPGQTMALGGGFGNDLGVDRRRQNGR